MDIQHIFIHCHYFPLCDHLSLIISVTQSPSRLPLDVSSDEQRHLVVGVEEVQGSPVAGAVIHQSAGVVTGTIKKKNVSQVFCIAASHLFKLPPPFNV